MFNIWPKRNIRKQRSYSSTKTKEKGYFKYVMNALQRDRRSINEMMFEELRDNGCLDCACKDFLEGPCGGLAQNIKCENCGSKYNIMPMGWAERI